MDTEKLIERLRASCLTTQGTDAISSLPYDAADALEASTRRVKELEEALGQAKSSLDVAASVPTITPHIADDVAALGRRFGYGALMGTASALWREELDELAGGEFVCGPCRATVERDLRRIRITLSQEGL